MSIKESVAADMGKISALCHKKTVQDVSDMSELQQSLVLGPLTTKETSHSTQRCQRKDFWWEYEALVQFLLCPFKDSAANEVNAFSNKNS